MRFFHRSSDPPVNGDLFFVVGLGNPGGKYEGTRHNIGFMTVEHLARRHGLRFHGSKQRADTTRGVIGDKQVLLALPVTFMNESGNAVSRLLGYYHIPRERLLVVCDDIDLPFGTTRLRPDGSAGGNNGLKSIAQHLGTTDFARLRLGVGRPPGSAISYVLGRFPPAEARLLPEVLDHAADAIEAELKDGVLEAMNRFNRQWVTVPAEETK